MAEPAKPNLRDVIAAGPGGGDSEIVKRYLGVPEGYQAFPGAGAGDAGNIVTNLGVSPRYSEGEQFAPGGNSPEDIARLQQQLDRAGLFTKSDKYRLGVWDDTSTDAYTRLLHFANQQGYDAPNALKKIGELSPDEYDALYGKGSYARSTTREGGVTGPGTEADVARGTITQAMSAEDLSYLADRTARQTLGRKLTADELGRFTGSYQAMLNAAVAREGAAQDQAEGGANVTYAGPTDPAAFADAQAQKIDPTAYQAHKSLDAFKTISSMLGGIGGGA